MPMKIDIIGALDSTKAEEKLNLYRQLGEKMVKEGAEGPSKRGRVTLQGRTVAVVSQGFAKKWGEEVVKATDTALAMLKAGNDRGVTKGITAVEGRFGGRFDDLFVLVDTPSKSGSTERWDIRDLGEADVEESNVHLRMEQDIRNPTSFSYGSGGTMNYGLRIGSTHASGEKPILSPRQVTTQRSDKVKLFVPDQTDEAGSLMQNNFFDPALESNIGEDFETDVYTEPTAEQRRKVDFKVVQGEMFDAVPNDGAVLGDVGGGTMGAINDGLNGGLMAFGEMDGLNDDIGSIVSKVKGGAKKVGGAVKKGAKATGGAVKKGTLAVTAPARNVLKATTSMTETLASGAKGASFLAKYGIWIAVGGAILVGLVGLLIFLWMRSKKAKEQTALPAVTPVTVPAMGMM
jgi:hypothetical protein